MEMENELAKIAGSNDAAQAVFSELLKRKRHRTRTDLNKLTRDLKLKSEQVVDTFKQLDKLGLGSIVVGRGINPTRFVWNYNLKDVAKAAKGGKPEELSVVPVFKNKPARLPVKPLSEAPINVPAVTAQETPTENINVLVINPKSGEVVKYRIQPGKEEIFNKLLGEFGSIE